MSVLVQGNNHDNNSNNKISTEDEPLTYIYIHRAWHAVQESHLNTHAETQQVSNDTNNDYKHIKPQSKPSSKTYIKHTHVHLHTYTRMHTHKHTRAHTQTHTTAVSNYREFASTNTVQVLKQMGLQSSVQL